MSDEYVYPEFVVKKTLSFNAIRVIGTRLVPTSWNIKAEMVYDEDDENEDPEYEMELKIATAKVRYFVDSVLNGSIMFCVDNEWIADALFDEEGRSTTSNNMIMMPDEPADDLVARVLHSKLNALGAGYLEFGIIELESNDKSGLTYMFTGDGETSLPLMEQWVGERAFYDKPWWARDDSHTIDNVPDAEFDLTEYEPPASDMDFIRQTFLRQNNNSATVLRPNFKPKVLDGGLGE